MSQIALVTNQHDNDVGVGMITKLLQPPCNILVGLVLAYVIDQQCSNGTTVVCGGDGAVSFLASSVPDLSLDGFGVHLDRSGSKLHTDSRLGIEVELVASKSAQQVGFTDA